jgi:hypothetical protein
MTLTHGVIVVPTFRDSTGGAVVNHFADNRILTIKKGVMAIMLSIKRINMRRRATISLFNRLRILGKLKMYITPRITDRKVADFPDYTGICGIAEPFFSDRLCG